jgi:hypothetical protein
VCVVFALAALSQGVAPLAGVPVARPLAVCDPASDREIIRIPQNLEDTYPFSARFSAPAAVGPGDLVIDLRGIRFATSGLFQRTAAGGPRFLMPDLSTFAPELRSGRTEGGYRYVVVQAATPQDQVTLRKHLEQSGMAILDYLPNMAYLVRVQAEGTPLLQSMPEVFWAGDFVPAFRVDSELDFVIEANPEHWMEVLALFDRALYATAEEVEAAAAASGATVRSVDEGQGGEWIIRLEGQAQAARSLVQIPGCLWTERYIPFELHNNMARTSSYVPTGRGSQAGPIMDVENVWAKGIHGEGQIASAADTGLSTGVLASLHKDFGDQSDPNNPMRVIKGYAIGRANDWSDDQMNTTDSSRGGHGTHTSGSIVGNGFRSGSTPSTDTYPGTCYAGVAPKAQFVIQSLMTSSGGLSVPADLNNLFSPPYGDGARVHSNSWGNTSGAGTYTTNSRNVDLFTWNNKDMVITFSAGNSGTDTSPADGIIDTNSVMPPATAKNCITVGASEDYHPDFAYEYPQGTCNANPTWNWFSSSSYATDPVKSDLMADNASGLGAFSSRGPLADSRFKPDVVAPGISVISTRTDKNQGWEQWGLCGIPDGFKPYYLYMGGTSMANPLTAGSAVLVRQYYVDGWHQNHSAVTNTSPNAPDGFNPSSALVKATLINGAWDMAPGQYGTGSKKEIPPGWDTGHDLPNNAEGYGRVDLMHSLFPGAGWGDVPERRLEVHDVTPGLQTGQSGVFTFDVTSGANPLIVTLVWTDPRGPSSGTVKLVNNLDLTVTAPGGTVYYPNGLNKTSGADSRNNVEQVKLTNPTVGTYTITVAGTAVPGNGDAGSTTQPYALVISGVSGCANSPASVNVTPEGPLTLCPGTAQLLAADVTGGTGPYSYQWTEDGADIPGANGATFSANAAGAHQYNCKVTGSGCTTFMADATPTSLTWQSYPVFAGLSSVSTPQNATCELDLTWPAAVGTCGPVTYNIYRSTTNGFAPSAANRIASGVSGTTYADSTDLTSGTRYYYVVRAVDGVSGAEDPNAVQRYGVPFGPNALATIYSENFDSASGLAGWGTGYFAGNANDWRGVQACSPAGSGTNIFRFGGTTCTGNYAQGAMAFAAPGGASGIAIPAGATNVTMTFNHRWNWFSQASPARRDGGIMLISINNANFYILPSAAISGTTYNSTTAIAAGCASNASGNGRSAWTGTQATMVSTTIDLDAACTSVFGSSAAGKTLYVAFTAITGCTGVNYGWFIDDVRIQGNVPGTCASTCPTIVLSPATLPDATVGTAYAQVISASGGSGSYDFAVTSGSLPSGLSLASDGTLSGVPTAAGTANFTVTATIPGTSCTGSRAYTLSANCPTVTLSPSTLPAPVVGVFYSQTITASGGTAPYSFAVTSGAPPTGLALAADGTLTGTPTTAGSYTFTVTATDTYQCAGTIQYTLMTGCPTVSIAPGSLPDAQVGKAYSQTITASGGTAPYTYAVTSGSLPAGVILSSGGSLSGTATVLGSFSFTVTATDVYQCAGSKEYSLNVVCPVVTLSPSALPGATKGLVYSQQIAGLGGTAPYTFAVTSGAVPAGFSLSPAGLLSGTGAVTGSWTFTVTATDAFGCQGSQEYTLAVFSAVFLDDQGKSRFCGDFVSGQFSWNVLSGPAAGQNFYGTGKVFNAGAKMTNAAGSPFSFSVTYDPVKHKASGWLVTPGGAYVALSDSDTANNPEGCN